MNDHVSKPIEPDNLFKTLVQWIPPRDQGSQQTDFEPSTEKIAEEKLPGSLEGIDIEEGLRRVGGNRKLYRKLLLDFYQDHGEDVKAIREALENSDVDKAHRIAHTIKGVSGSIGAENLYKAAEKLDAALNKGQQDTYYDLLSGLEDALAPVVQGLEVLSALGEKEDTGPVDAGPVDVEAVAALLEKLQSLLEEMDPEAENEMAALKAQLGAQAHQELVKKLSKQVGEFEFEEALQTLNKLRKSL
jgi:HPt (histidine-containing phosphotransfer) domain-containing protein